MNVVFITISGMPQMDGHSISVDLLHEFKRQGHNVFIVCSLERKFDKDTSLTDDHGFHVLRVKIGNNKKANLIEKGITNITLPNLYIKAIKKYFSDIKFDLILYPTPPITHYKTVKYLKKRDGARTYLLLKDIFPQNAVDIGMMSKSGIKGLMYKYFRRIEKKLYKISDYIGCMSQANVDYVLKHNPEVELGKVEICPNSIEVEDKSVDAHAQEEIRKKYSIPEDKKVFLYGGNLGKPQGIPFLMKCLEAEKNNEKVFFLIVGDGTEFNKIDLFLKNTDITNARLMKKLPKADYDAMVGACDVGLIFLDHRFTIPNFPSRSLAYMQAKVPILAVTDPNTDIGKVIVEGGFGWWCESNNARKFAEMVESITKSDIKTMGSEGYRYLENNYTVENQYGIIMKHFG